MFPHRIELTLTATTTQARTKLILEMPLARRLLPAVNADLRLLVHESVAALSVAVLAQYKPRTLIISLELKTATHVIRICMCCFEILPTVYSQMIFYKCRHFTFKNVHSRICYINSLHYGFFSCVNSLLSLHLAERHIQCKHCARENGSKSALNAAALIYIAVELVVRRKVS